MFVKICGLRTPEHVEAAVEAGADAIGFVFADSVRKIDPAEAAAIINRVSGTILKVAVMLRPSGEELQRVLDEFGPDVLQTDADDLAGLEVPSNVEVWPVLRESSVVTAPLVSVLKASNRFLFEGARSGSGETVDWDVAAKVAEQGNMILAGGLDATNVGRAIGIVQPFGVDVSSGIESAPGQKDTKLIKDFISAAKAAGKQS